jgi:hypothetical protein
MKLKLLVVALFCSVVGWGQSIFENPITGTNPDTSNPYTTGQIVNPNITVSGISRGTGIAGTNANNRYNANGWSIGAIDFTDYFEFTLTPNSGFRIDFVNFLYKSQVSAGTPNHQFRSSIDGFSSGIGTPNTAGTTIDLTGASYQNITTAVTFRFYTFGVTAVTTTYSINDFTFNGTVTSTTPPTIVPIVTSNTVDITTTYGTAFTNYTVTANESPTSYAATGLPAGVTINTTSGLISGTSSVVGTFPVSLTATNIIGTSTAVIKNYIVNPKPLTTIGLTSANKVYDGTTTATLGGTAALSGGIVGADVITLSGTPVSNYAAANVGTNYVITTTGYTLSGAYALKYTITQPSVINRNITQRPLTISGITSNN